MSRSGSPCVTRWAASAKLPTAPARAEFSKRPKPAASASSPVPSRRGTAKSSPNAGIRTIADTSPYELDKVREVDGSAHCASARSTRSAWRRSDCQVVPQTCQAT